VRASLVQPFHKFKLQVCCISKESSLFTRPQGEDRLLTKDALNPILYLLFLSLNGTNMFQKQLKEKFKMSELCYTGVFSLQRVSLEE